MQITQFLIGIQHNISETSDKYLPLSTLFAIALAQMPSLLMSCIKAGHLKWT